MKRILSASVACLILCCSLFLVVSCGNSETVEFTLEVVHLDGSTKTFEVKTDASNVGDALQEKGYIDGYQSQYGLTVETVDGETLDWDKSGAYWAFYINGEYAMTGVSSTTPEDGATYTFKAEKFS